MKRPLWTPEAILDLRELRSYVVRRNPLAAQRLVKDIRTRCCLIASVPGMGSRPKDPEDLPPGIFLFPSHPYNIFYRLTDTNRVEIVRLLHEGRDRSGLF